MKRGVARVVSASLLLGGFVGVFGWLGCSTPSPSGVSPVADSSTDDSGAATDGMDQRCSSPAYGDAGDACDDCLNKNCCDERFTCYDDCACYWADWVLDACETPGVWGEAGVPWTKCDGGPDAGDDTGSGDDTSWSDDSGAPVDSGSAGADGDAGSKNDQCWQHFAVMGGALGKSLDTCMRASCSSVCIP